MSAQINAPAQALVEAQWQDGEWRSIGYVGDGDFYNPAVPEHYRVDPDTMHLRVRGQSGSELRLPVTPVITELSAERAEGRISVKGRTTLLSGGVYAFSDGAWKGIADIENGIFSNTKVPNNYLFEPETLRVRVQGNLLTSLPVDATLGFPHSRTVLVRPMMLASAEAAEMSWRLHKADYQPTGYYAVANQDIEVWVSGNAGDLTLLVGIQGMADRDDPAQQSANMRATRLVAGRNVIRDPLGGVIHLRSLLGPSNGITRVIVGGDAIPIPYYQQGLTSAAEWRHMLNVSNAPEVELVGRQVVVAAFRKTALKFVNIAPESIVGSHEEVLRLEAEVSGLDGSTPLHSRSSLLIYAVEARANANPHATTGYIGLPYSDGAGMYAEALVGGKAANRWVALHEYGHHYQNRTNGIHPFGEVSVNLYSLAVGRVHENEYTHSLPGRWPALEAWLAQPRGDKDFERCPDPMAIYEQLRKGLGQAFLPAWDRYIREHPVSAPGLKDFILSASIVSRFDLANFFADWGVLKEENSEIWAAVAALNLPQPPVGLTSIRPYIVDPDAQSPIG
ncbi:M60 family metallopeptidase [Pseudomonas sp. TNT2022 ID609]|uniref:M60 family metallopeptidase n=1 Tax=Pseudomonas rubra TaxID=2942627 RepID=UPI00235E0993|nr:M60 family metallopeptidase [Pseudomonas rubra]MDD1041618.1 M60 family metallopeptidase [Pseudomonas rubra]